MGILCDSALIHESAFMNECGPSALLIPTATRVCDFVSTTWNMACCAQARICVLGNCYAWTFLHSLEALRHNIHSFAIADSAVTLSFIQTHSWCVMVLPHMHLFHIDLRMYVCRAEDYWEGYKLFCYAYYSHSLRHELEFHQSKLGSSMSWFSSFLGFPEFVYPANVCYCY